MEQKLLMRAESEDEGIALAEVARRLDALQQLSAWRNMMRNSSPGVPVPAFLSVEIAEPPTAEPAPERGRRTKAV